jgi:hypothetical protein
VTGPLRPRGHIPDDPAVVKNRVGLHWHPKIGEWRNAAAAGLPMGSNNRAKLAASSGGPGILDQTNSSTCEGHGHASAISLDYAVAGTPIDLPSPLALYYGAQLLSGALNPNGTLPPLFDQGTTPDMILKALQVFGFSSASTWGQYPANSSTLLTNPSDPNSPMVPVKPEQLHGASPLKLTGAYFITSSGNQKVLDILTVLAAGKTITDAIPASGQQFQGYSGGVLGALDGPIDHCNLIADFGWLGSADQWTTYQAALKSGDSATVSSLDQYLLVYGVNSWGLQWGEGDAPEITGGMYRGNRAFIDQVDSPCATTFQKVT